MTATEAIQLVRQRHEAEAAADGCEVCKALDVIEGRLFRETRCASCNGVGKRFEWTGRKWETSDCAACSGTGAA